MLHVAAAMPDRDDIALDEARHLLIEAEAERRERKYLRKKARLQKEDGARAASLAAARRC